ncbi:ribonuclease III [Fibrobacterales bacterium]|nr:ribonuclease III [Fibrobacterales bacterium]
MRHCEEMTANRQTLAVTLGLSFSNPDLLTQALTHDSWRQEHKISKSQTYQRLEFLGDSVVNFLTAEYLFRKYPHDTEGALSKKKSALVSGVALSGSAKKWKLSKCLRVAEGVDRNNPALLADAFEAVLGAVYLEMGVDKCRLLLNAALFSRESEILKSDIFCNPKTMLNERAQELMLGAPIYFVLEEWGEEHKREFRVGVDVGGERVGEGTGFSKKEAEQKAAKIALERF